MKKNLINYILITCVIFSLCSCTWQKEVIKTPQSITETNNLFELTITTDSSKYSKKTPIECYAALKYIGDEPITVYHGDPLVVFNIEDDRYFNNDGIRNAVLMNTTFKPNEEIQLEFQKSGGWESNKLSALFYNKFYSEEDLILPKGEYILSANLEYSLDEDEVLDTQQAIIASVNVAVK